MKLTKYLIMALVLLMVGCHRLEKVTPEALKPLVGRWRSVDFAGGDLIIRYDGVVLDAEGRGLCCRPSIIQFNGVQYPIEPKAEIPYNEACSQIYCAGCPVWDIALDGDTFVLTGCGRVQSRYARIR